MWEAENRYSFPMCAALNLYSSQMYDELLEEDARREMSEEEYLIWSKEREKKKSKK